MKNLRVVIQENSIIRSYVLGLLRLIEGFRILSFYTFKVFLELTSLLIAALKIFFCRVEIENNTNESLLLVLVGKYIDNLDIVNFDFYHLVNRLEEEAFENSPNQNLVYSFFENQSFKHLLKRSFELLSYSRIVILASSWSPRAKSISHPSKFYFHLIHWLSKDFKLVIIGWDSVSSGFWKGNIIDREWVDVKVTENPNLIGLEKSITYRCKIDSILMPIHIHGDNLILIKNRRYDVFFSGKMNSYRDYRLPYIESVRNLNIVSFINKINKTKDLMTYEDLYGALGHSKIGINFSKSVDQNEQLKGRVWETMLCGALLLEQENSQITNYFTPNVHFVFFSSPEDLANKVVFYLNHPAELKKIAEAGTLKAQSFQSKVHLW
jgi:hypothetical protein